jgi:hypothetical protein
MVVGEWVCGVGKEVKDWKVGDMDIGLVADGTGHVSYS